MTVTDVRPDAVVWAYWRELLAIEENATMLEVAYLIV